MNQFCNSLFAGTICFFLSCPVLSGQNESIPQAKTGKRPNFLFILTDDQAPYSLGAYGNKVANTPNLDRIARNGIRIDGAYHMGAFMGAVCTNSRHMIMTGRTLWHIPRAVSRSTVLSQINGESLNKKVKKPNIPEGLEEYSLPAVFNRAGYDTMRTCKRGNSYPAANAKFKVVRDASKRKTGQEGSAWHADQVLEYLVQRQAKDVDTPFFIYFGLSHPHDPRYANPKLLEKYGATNDWKAGDRPNPNAPSLPVNYLPKHPFQHGHPGLRDEVAVQGVSRDRSEGTVRNEKGREYACIENIDQQIGRVLKQLKQMGELENTYVFFTSDHGIAIGRHGLMGKQSLYEHSWRVPMLAMGKNIKPGSVAQGNVYLLDLLATFCEIAKIDPPNTNEGISFKSVLEGRTSTIRDELYGCYCGGTRPGMRAIRKGDWKLIKYETMDGKVKQTQLFNLSENPNELLKEHHQPEVVRLTGNQPQSNQVNLANDPEFKAKRKELENRLVHHMEKLHDPYRFDENYINPPPKARPRKNRQKKIQPPSSK